MIMHAYSAIQIAVALADAFHYSVNNLPVFLSPNVLAYLIENFISVLAICSALTVGKLISTNVL